MKVWLIIEDDDGQTQIEDYVCDYVWLGLGSHAEDLGHSFAWGSFKDQSVNAIVQMAVANMAKIDPVQTEATVALMHAGVRPPGWRP